ncbi:hypothetical protein L2E68_12235 [Planktothrix agardhii 1029]|jgi:hypothetical protein|uniref:hypothetical protein n=1 Tax=Planktothrix agardhii TaxID=1160 RepID=UPI001D0A5C41|nr:hypothetical protein [Planktothrix agardhii]MCB8751527.1 hypothetical protein [Planktothrix agardhii 1810]MCB8751804.1 hypothetical protein [Planktothrix agardhii 1810]MCB8763841.1 hypothetical protein [Planktothrix agardhii 1809]MCB8777474.1 hypothetical protein [Planktothrix agardhii 1031]MCB8781898.1 hypothetical protein [Planktothrix agardhii 1808]
MPLIKLAQVGKVMILTSVLSLSMASIVQALGNGFYQRFGENDVYHRTDYEVCWVQNLEQLKQRGGNSPKVQQLPEGIDPLQERKYLKACPWKDGVYSFFVQDPSPQAIKDVYYLYTMGGKLFSCQIITDEQLQQHGYQRKSIIVVNRVDDRVDILAGRTQLGTCEE